MARLYVNNYSSTLVSAITDTDTGFTVTNDTGLPALSGGDTFTLTLAQGGTIEIVEVTAKTGTALTVTRAQESTTAVAWPAGTVVSLRATAASFSGILTGPGSSTDNAIPKFDGTSGSELESTNVFINDDDQLLRDTTSGITASTTQTQGQQPLDSDVNQVSTVANANDVVTLPDAEEGKLLYIINDGANTLQIFPASGDDLGNGVDASTTLAAGGIVGFTAYDATNWAELATGGGDTPVVTQVVWDSSDKAAGVTLSGGDTIATYSSGTRSGVGSNDAKTSGKWYFEVDLGTVGGSWQIIGISPPSSSRTVDLGQTADCFGYVQNGGTYFDTTYNAGAGYTAFSSSDVVGVAFDIDGGTIEFFLNNVSQGIESVTLDSGTGYVAACSMDSSPQVSTIVSDQDNFTYAPPPGFNALTLESNLELSGNNVQATNTNGDVNLVPDGTGVVTIGGDLNVLDKDIVSTSGRDIDLHSDNDVNIILGDDAGVDDFNIRDSANAVVASINSDGAIDAPSITFNGGTDLLEEYEVGTWTPVVDAATTGDLSVSYSSRTGRYIRIGDLVVIYYRLRFTPTYTTASGQLVITGIPFTPVRFYAGMHQFSGTNFTFNADVLVPIADSLNNRVFFREINSATAATTVSITGLGSGVSSILDGNIYYVLD